MQETYVIVNVFLGKYGYDHLSRLLADTTCCHPNIDVFAFEIVTIIGEQGGENLVDFWSGSLEPTLFSSTADRKYLGFRLAIHSLPFITTNQVICLFYCAGICRS